MKKYKIYPTEVQKKIIEDALNLYVCVGTGKLEEVNNLFSHLNTYDKKNLDLLRLYKARVYGLEFHEFFDIHGLPTRFMTAQTLKISDELCEEELRTIMIALDLYSRLGIGQIHELSHVVHLNARSETELLYNFKVAVFPELTDMYSFYSICSEEVDDRYKDAFDMIKTIQHCLAEDLHVERWSVWWDGNLLKLGNEPIMKIDK